MSSIPKKIQIEQAIEFLTAHFGKDVVDVEIVGKGLWSQSFFFRRANADYVLRFGNEGESYEKDRIASKYSSNNLPIPTITETGTALGLYFAISERASGTMIDELEQNEMDKMISTILEMLNAIREANISATTGYGHWDKNEAGQYSSWQKFLLAVGTDDPKSKIHGWRASLESSPQGNKLFDQITHKLKILAEKCYAGRHLIHTDLLHFNVLAENNKISAVIDWGNAMYGDFLYDLANFTFWAPLHPAIQKIDWKAKAREYFIEKGIEIQDFEKRLHLCELHIGLAGMAWNAHNTNWKELEATSKRIMDLAEDL